AVGIDRHDVKVLVALEVLHIDDAVRTLPEVAGDVALGLAGDAHRGPARARLHEHVHPPLVGLHERDVPSVRRDLEAGLLRVAEEVGEGNERGGAGILGRCDIRAREIGIKARAHAGRCRTGPGHRQRCSARKKVTSAYHMLSSYCVTAAACRLCECATVMDITDMTHLCAARSYPDLRKLQAFSGKVC